MSGAGDDEHVEEEMVDFFIFFIVNSFNLIRICLI
jgi:hypothetical protein